VAAAAAILLNPAIALLSAGWGQVDSVPALLLTSAFLLLFTGGRTSRRRLGGATLVALALGVKPQVVFVLPVVALVLLRRDWRRPLRLATLGVPSVAVSSARGVAFALASGPLGHP